MVTEFSLGIRDVEDAIPYGCINEMGANGIGTSGTACQSLAKHRHSFFGYDRVEPYVVRLGREGGDELKAIAQPDF